MRNTLISLSLAGTLAIAGAATAADTEGTIVRTDDAKGIILLDDGRQLQAGPGVDTSKLDWGQPLEITLETVNGKTVATYFEENSNKEDAD